VSYLLNVVRLIPGDLSINASGGDVSYNSKTLDISRKPRVNAIVARGLSPGSFGLDYKVFFYQGITTSEIAGDPTGQSDRFEEPDVNPPLISTYPASGLQAEGYQAWIVVPMPAILTPFVRFHILVKGGSAADGKFNLYGVVQDRLDG
jgi:hypothetical protein